MAGSQRLVTLGLGASLVAALAFTSGTFLRADDTPEAPARKAAVRQARGGGAMAEPREAAAILRDLRELADSVRREGEARPAVDRDVPARPERTVAPPTITPDRIDQLVEAGLSEAKTAPARLTTDEEFVRRVYLDLAGRAPTPEEFRQFVGSKQKGKRAELIDRLLAGDDYAANWARYWRDVFRSHATVEQPRLLDFPALETWLTEKLAANTPWDEMARGIIAATGDNEENGATVFTAAHMGQPVEVAGEVSRVFLGVQIQCAQCHDHPSDPWEREQFHEFAAFFAGVQARRKPQGQRGTTINVRKGTPRYTMPDLKDPLKSIPVAPRFFLASSEQPAPAGLSAQERRELAAELITAQENPWFARAFINRIWYALLGDAFVVPVDDMGPNREAKYPELLDELAGQFAAGGYDVKWLFRTILNTKAYQREVRSTASPAGRQTFAANCSSRLRADQIYDQLVALGVRFGGGRAATRGQAGAGAAQALRRLGARGVFDVLFNADPSTPHEEVLGTIPQALFLMNSPPVTAAVRAGKGTVLGELLPQNPDNRAALEALYLRVLSRRPTADEVKLCGQYLQRVGDRREAFEDIFWCLLNSTEFLSRR
jgi:hypothetical protein